MSRTNSPNRQHHNQCYSMDRQDLGRGYNERCFRVECRCGRFQIGGNENDMRLPPEAVHQIFRKLGWLVGKNKRSHRCPECQIHPSSTKEIATMSNITTLKEIGPALEAKKEPARGAVRRAAVQFEERAADDDGLPPFGEPQPEPTVQTRALTVPEIIAVTRALDENFDEKVGAYLKDWSDEKIAIYTGIPRACVIKMREEGPWGKIRVFSDIQTLRNDIQDLKALLRDMELRVAEIERKRIATK